jgi:hypothetical protein
MHLDSRVTCSQINRFHRHASQHILWGQACYGPTWLGAALEYACDVIPGVIKGLATT